jgi:hypothetical protein
MHRPASFPALLIENPNCPYQAPQLPLLAQRSCSDIPSLPMAVVTERARSAPLVA